MKPNGLPDADVPSCDRGEKPCRDCKHSYFAADERGHPDLFNNECEGMCGV